VKPALLAITALLLAGACASTSPYREATSASASGYSEQVVETDRYRVQYRMAGRDARAAQDYALLRAAELTLEKGYSTFEIVSREAETSTEDAAFPASGVRPDYVVSRRCGLLGCTATARPLPPTFDTETNRSKKEVVVVLEVRLSNKDASASSSLYSASQVVANLRAGS
jgi:hypothetical protein